ncbi:hypothetical protein FRC19_005436 [Serendipita sp. 401]|nr:hypothetical protein FRC19_005436 [Serendipita sp. 401]
MPLSCLMRVQLAFFERKTRESSLALKILHPKFSVPQLKSHHSRSDMHSLFPANGIKSPCHTVSVHSQDSWVSVRISKWLWCLWPTADIDWPPLPPTSHERTSQTLP